MTALSVCSVVSEYGMPYCIMLLHAAHFAAETIAARGDGHGVGAVGRGLHEYRNLEAGEADGVDDAALFTEVGQRDDDAVDLIGMLLEQLGAALRLGIGFHRAVLRFLGPSTTRVRAAASSTAMISSRPVLAR